MAPRWGAATVVAGAVMALLLAQAAAAPSRAAAEQVGSGGARFDGQWTIDASVSSFFCPIREKQLTAVVHGGIVTRLTGLPGVRASGVVDGRGGVTLSLETLGHNAHIQGNLHGRSGEGGWSSDSRLCAQGAWRAHTP